VLLHRAASGDREAEKRLLDAVYAELRGIAARYMAEERGDHLLQPTALINEALIRLLRQLREKKPVDGEDEHTTWLPAFPNRRYFFAAAAEAMRRTLVEYARKRLRQKRGGGTSVASLRGQVHDELASVETVLAVHEALDQLAEEDSLAALVVKLRYFAGLSLRETAEVLQVSRSTVSRRWAFARAWLIDRLSTD